MLQYLSPSTKAILDALRVSGGPMGTGALASLAGVSRMSASDMGPAVIY